MGGAFLLVMDGEYIGVSLEHLAFSETFPVSQGSEEGVKGPWGGIRCVVVWLEAVTLLVQHADYHSCPCFQCYT